MNKLVSFELAKLLKEKRFDEQSLTIYQDGEILFLKSTISNSQFLTSRNYTAPTIAEVVMWLYENHGIWISVSDAGGFGYMIQFMKIDGDSTIEGLYEYDSPTEAYEAAIKYSLELI